jgi:hypothetical protein
VRIAVDVTPLRLTGAGTARYLRSLLARVQPTRRVAFGGPGRGAVLARELARADGVGADVRAQAAATARQAAQTAAAAPHATASCRMRSRRSGPSESVISYRCSPGAYPSCVLA